MADKRTSFGSIEELMSIDPKVAKMITGEYFQEKIDRQAGKDEAQKQAEREAAQRAMAVRSIKAGANELAGIYSEEGYDVRYTIDSKTMKVQMFLIPREVKNKEKLTLDELKQYKTVDIFLNNDRLIDKNGQRGIGGIVPVEVGEDIGIYSFAEHQIWAQVEEAKKQYAKQQLKDRTAEGNKTYTKAMRRARRKASSQQATAGQQVPLTPEGRDARSGTGTKEQIALRDEMVFADHILSQFLTDKNIQKTLKRGYKKAEYGSYEAYLNKLQNAAFGIAGLLSKGWTEEEIAKSDPMYKIITTSSSLMGKLKKLSQLGLYHTLTSESAGSNFIYSAMPKSAVSGGWADEESSNKRLKVSNRMEVLNPNAKQNKTIISGSITPFEKAAGINLSDAERRLYAIQKRKIDFFNKARKILYDEKVTNGSMTEEEFVKEYGTELSGLGLDSLIYSSEIEEGLGGFEYRPEKIDTDKVKREVERLKRVKKDETHSDDEWMSMAVASLLDVAEQDIIKIDSESSDKFVRIEYKFKQEMMSGFKLLLQQAYERGAAIKVHKDIFDVARDVNKMASVGETALSKESTLIEEASPLKAKGISGFLAQTMAAVTAVGKMNPTARKRINAILEKTGLGDYVKWDDATRGYLEDYSSFENKTDSEKEAYFNNIIPALNNLTKAIGIATKDIVKIETDKEGKTTYTVSDEWVGRTAANQISQYRYGEPGGEVVSYGYRGRGAINRAIAMASITKKDEKQNLDALNSFLMDVTNVDEESQKFYNKAREDAEDSRKRTLASAAADFKINEDKNEALFKITEEQLKADREINEARTAGGYFDKEAFEKTSMYAIYKMMHPDDPNAPGKKVYIDYGNAGTLAQTDEGGKRVWGSSATALTDFQVEEVRDKSGAIIGYKLNENLAKGYRGIVEARERYGEIGGDSQHNLDLLTDAAIEYGKIVHDDVESKEGISWNKGNVTKVAHSMFAMTEAANYALLEELFNDATLEIGDTDFSKLTKEQQLEIAKKRNLKHILSSAEQMSAEDAAELMRAHGDTKQTAHMSTLMNEYKRIYGKDAEEWYKEQQQLDAEEQKRELQAKYKEKLDRIEEEYQTSGKNYYRDKKTGEFVYGFEKDGKWIDFADYGKERAKQDDVEFLTDQEYGAYGFRAYRQDQALASFQEEWEGIEEIATKPIADLSEKGAKIINEKLIQSIIDGVTVGSKAFEERIRKNIEEGGNGIVEGLFEILARFPESNGVDRKFVEAYIASDLNAGQSRVGLGLGRSVNQDNDGDRIARHFALMSTKALESRNYEEIVAEFRQVKSMMDDISEMVAKAELKDMKKNAGKGVVLTSEDIKELSSKRRADVTALKAKLNKNYTGWLSNEYQGVTEAMSYLGIDEKGLGTDVASQTKSANAMITRGFFESLTQDAISSKKVADRIVGKYGDDAFEEGSQFFTDLDSLVKSLSNPETYKDIDGLVRKIQEMKILGEDGDDEGVFTTRINELVLGTISKYGHGGEILRNLFGEEALKKHFGDKQYTDEDILKAVKNADLHLGTEQLIRALQLTHETLKASGEGGIGEVIRGRRWHVPGLMGIKGDPVSTLGLSVADLGPSYQHLLEIVDKLTGAVDRERAAEEAKIKVLGKEKAAVGNAGSAWSDYIDKIEKAYNVHDEFNNLMNNTDSFNTYGKHSAGFQKASVSDMLNILFPSEREGKSGLNQKIVKKVAKQRLSGKEFADEELIKLFGVDSIETLNSQYGTTLSQILGNLNDAIASGNRKEANTLKKEVRNLMTAFGKTNQEIEDQIKVIELGGKSQRDIAKQYGKAVGFELPTAGVANGFLLNGKMDALYYMQKQNEFDPNKMDDVYTIIERKAHKGGYIGTRDIFQGLAYKSLLEERQATWRKSLYDLDLAEIEKRGFTDEEREKIKAVRDADAAAVFGAQKIIGEESLESYKKTFGEDAGDEGLLHMLRMAKGAKINLAEVITDTLTGETTAHAGPAHVPAWVNEAIRAGTAWEDLPEDKQKELYGLMEKQYGPKLYNPGMETEASKEEERNKAQKEYVDLLEREYDLKLKLEKWKKDYGAQEGSSAYNLLLDQKNKEIEDAEKASKEMAKKAGLDPNKNDLLSRYEAEHQLKLADMANKAVGGSGGGQKQSIWNQMGWSKDGLTRTITQFFSLYRILGKVRQTIQKVVNITKQLDQAATNIRIVTGMNREEVDTTILSYSKLAKELGSTTVELANSANTWLRQGYSVAESMDLIAASTKLSKLGMLDMGSATKVLTSTLKGFKMQASEATTIVDKLTKLDMNYAASAGEIGEAMARTSAIASQMGMSLDETAAMVTTIMDVTQQSSEMAGTAVRSILSRYGNVKSGSFLSMMTGDEEDLEKINDIEKVLNVLGISIRSSKMEMRDMGSVLDELAVKWNTLSTVEQSAVATAFAGVRQRNFFTVMLSNWDRVREAQEIAASSAGTADEKYGAYLDSIEANVKKLQNAWENFTQSLNNNIFIKAFLKTTTFIVENFGRITTALLTLFTVLNTYKVPGWISGLFGHGKGAMVGGLTSASTNMSLATGKSKRELGLTNIGNKIDKAATRIVNAINGTKGSGSLSNFKLGTKESVNKEIQKVQNDSKLSPEEKKTRINDLKNWKSGKGYWTTNTKGQEVGAVYRDGAFYNISTGKKINPNSKIGKQLATQKSAAKKAKIGTAVVAGVMGALSGYATGPQDSLGVWKRGDISINDIESTQADKITNGIAVGGLTAIGSMFGPLGAALGGVVGGEIGNLIKWIAHRDEMERKQRVEDAKKQLEALNKIQTAVTSVESAIYDLSSASAVTEAKTAVDELISTLLSSDYYDEIMKALAEASGLEEGEKIDLAQLESVLLGGDNDLKESYMSTIKTLLASNTADQKYRAQEEDRYQARDKLGDIKTEEGYREAQAKLKYFETIGFGESIWSKTLKKDIEAYEKYQLETQKLNRELWSSQLTEAFGSSGLSTWKNVDIKAASLEEVIQIFANDLTLAGVAVRDVTGELTDAARDQITTYLRQNEKFNKLTTQEAKTYNELRGLSKKQQELVKQTRAASYEELKKAFDTSSEKMQGFADNFGGKVDELRRQVYKVDTTELDHFINALHGGTEMLAKYESVLGTLTSADLLKSQSELKESTDTLTQAFTTLASKGSLSGEMLEKITSQYFTLFNKYDESGNIVSTSADNVMENIIERLFGTSNSISTQGFLYQNATFNSILENADFYKSFKAAAQNAGMGSEIMTELNAGATLKDVLSTVNKNETLSKVLTNLLNDLHIENDYAEELQNSLANWQKHENKLTIDNLNSQIEALNDVNSERKKEIELIKAKEALENAKKEKKRVYRAGVGWTYETDQEAIASAQEKLEDLETGRDKENLQYQIDLLEQQNSILDNIAENEQLKGLKSAFETYEHYMEDVFGEKVTNGLQLILKLVDKDNTINWDEYVGLIKQESENKTGAEESAANVALQAMAQSAQTMSSAKTTAKGKGGDIAAKASAGYSEAETSFAKNYNKFLGAANSLGYTVDEYLNSDMLTDEQKKTYSKLLGYEKNTKTGKYTKSAEDDEYSDLREGKIEGVWGPAYELYDPSGNTFKKKGYQIYFKLDQGLGFHSEEFDEILDEGVEDEDKNMIHKLEEDGVWVVKKKKKDKWPDKDTRNGWDDGIYHFAGGGGKTGDYDNAYVLKQGNQWSMVNPMFYSADEGEHSAFKDITNDQMKWGNYEYGTFGLGQDTNSLINEAGLEGIITPQGTITALPAHTGIVPADLTRNLYQLGELAPTLIRRSFGDTSLLTRGATATNQDNSMKFNNLYATFNADGDFDFEQLLIQARQYLATTRSKNK